MAVEDHVGDLGGVILDELGNTQNPDLIGQISVLGVEGGNTGKERGIIGGDGYLQRFLGAGNGRGLVPAGGGSADPVEAVKTGHGSQDQRKQNFKSFHGNS